jgi:nucleoside-diphosphate-sugar epimerase
MDKVLVIGGSGFIGSAIQRYVIREQLEDLFTFTYNEKPEKLHKNLNRIHLDLLGEVSEKVKKYPNAIYVAGNANHGLAKRSPLLDLDFNVRAFLNFIQEFRGSLVLLSSQATYYGLEGKISEAVDHVATIPYGISKSMVEAYAKYFLRTRCLSKLWIFRLMYAYGKGEKEHRLIPRCAKAFRKGSQVTIFGGGKSFLNPLPSEFVAKVLVKASESLRQGTKQFLKITNINYPEKVTTKDLVAYLNQIEPFNFTISDEGEEWPVRFWGDTENLLNQLQEWNMDFPDLWGSLKKYYGELKEGKTE